MKTILVIAATAMVASAQSLYELFEKKAPAQEDTHLETLTGALGNIIPCSTNAYCRSIRSDACCAQITASDPSSGATASVRTCGLKSKVEELQRNPPKNVQVYCLRESLF